MNILSSEEKDGQRHKILGVLTTAAVFLTSGLDQENKLHRLKKMEKIAVVRKLYMLLYIQIFQCTKFQVFITQKTCDQSLAVPSFRLTSNSADL